MNNLQTYYILYGIGLKSVPTLNVRPNHVSMARDNHVIRRLCDVIAIATPMIYFGLTSYIAHDEHSISFTMSSVLDILTYLLSSAF